MENNSLYNLKYPIGEFETPSAYTSVYLNDKIDIISKFPNLLKQETSHLTESQLNTPYRNNGWTIRQVIHHCAESHMNCFIRIKWTLTENKPHIKAYDESLWAELIDDRTLPIEPSLQLLEGLHQRMTFLMKNLTPAELDKSFIHPENNKTFTLKKIIGLYAWHCSHHLAHITELKKRENWL